MPLDWPNMDDPRTPEDRQGSKDAELERIRARVRHQLRVPPGSFPIPEPPEPREPETLQLGVNIVRSDAHDSGHEFYAVRLGMLVRVPRADLQRGDQFFQAPKTLDDGPALKYGRCGEIVAINENHIFFVEITGDARPDR